MIRFKVFLPVVALVVLVGWFLSTQLDRWLANKIESTISSITGTKTDVNRLRISFVDSSIRIAGLEVASSKEEFKNLTELSEIVLDFQFLPLLEKRFVVDEFSVRGIDWGTPRQRSGFLPPKPKDDKPSWLSKQLDSAFDSVTAEFKNLPVARLADFRVPSNPKEVLERLDLESEKALRATVINVQQSQTEWRARVSELRDLSEYKRVIAEARSLTQKLPQDPRQILERVETVKKSVSFFQSEVDRAESLVKAVETEYSNLKNQYKEAVQAIDSDYNRAKGVVSLDQLNLDNLSRLIFGSQWVARAQMVLGYHAMLRGYAAKLKSSEDEKVEVRQRAKGRDIIFIVPKKKPGFVLAKSEFTVTGLEKAAESERLSQHYRVDLEGLNSAPKLYGSPTKLDLEAKFKNFSIAGADLNFFWDYTTETLTDRYTARVEKLKASEWPVGIPEVFPLKMAKGSANLKSELEFVGEDFKWITRADFSSVNWDMRAVPRIGFIIPAMSEVLEQIQRFFVEFEFSQKESQKFQYKVRSDLDQKFKNAIGAVIDKKWKEFQAKLRAEINRRVEKYKAEALKELNQYRDKVKKEVEDRLALAKNYESEAKNKIKELQASAKKAAEQKVKNEVQQKVKDQAGEQVKELKKSLPFGKF